MKRIAAVVGSMAVCAFYAFPLSIGEKAFAFTLTTTGDSPVSLAQYQGRVCVLYFFCCGCSNERATGSAVEKYIWQAYKDDNVEVLGIEIARHTRDAVIASGKQWGITFPVAINGHQTASAYGNASNEVVLIDKQGFVQAVAAVPLSLDTLDAQIDSTVKSFAGEISALLTAAIKQRRMGGHCAAYGPVGDNAGWTSDLKGRKLERAGAAKASQRLVDCARNAGTFLRGK
jgi:peroxiredoxin